MDYLGAGILMHLMLAGFVEFLIILCLFAVLEAVLRADCHARSVNGI